MTAAVVRVEFALLASAKAESRVEVTVARLATTPDLSVIGAARNLCCRTWRFAFLCWQAREVPHDASSASQML